MGGKPTGQKGGLSLSSSAPDGRGTAPRPPHLQDLLSARPHLARRQTPSDCCPDSPIPAKHFSQANTFQSSVAHCVCIHMRTHACTRAHMHTALTPPQSPARSWALSKYPHSSCLACPSNSSSRFLSCLVMPALGCNLTFPAPPPPPQATYTREAC